MQRTAIVITALLSLANGQIVEQPTSTPTYIPIAVDMNATDTVINQQGTVPVNINLDPNFYQPPGYNYKPTTNLPYPEGTQCYPPQQSCAPPCATGQYPAGGYQYPTSGYQYPNGGYQYPAGGYQYPAGGYQYPANGCNQYPHYQNICPTPCQTSACGVPLQNGGYQYPSGFFGVNGNQYQNGFNGYAGPSGGYYGGYNGQCGRPYCPTAPSCGPYQYGPGPYSY
jgi:hypothetical protein